MYRINYNHYLQGYLTHSQQLYLNIAWVFFVTLSAARVGFFKEIFSRYPRKYMRQVSDSLISLDSPYSTVNRLYTHLATDPVFVLSKVIRNSKTQAELRHGSCLFNSHLRITLEITEKKFVLKRNVTLAFKSVLHKFQN